MSKIDTFATADALVTIDGVEYRAVPATIRSTHLGYEDHGIFTSYLHVEGKGWGQGVGGYTLDDKPDLDNGRKERQPTILCGALVQETIHALGVRKWEDLPGVRVHVLYEKGSTFTAQALGVANADLTEAVVLDNVMREYTK